MALVTADFDVATTTLDSTDVDTLFATPVTIVAAPGSGIVLVPLGVSMHITRGATAWSDIRTPKVQYAGDTNQQIQAFSHAWTSAGARDHFGIMGVVTTLTALANNFDPSNKALQLTFETGDTSPGSTDLQFVVHVLYARISGLY